MTTPATAMRLLPIDPPPFTRVVWTTPAAREAWAHSLGQVSKYVHDLEIESVAMGQRPCTWQTVAEVAYPEWSARLLERGLVAMAVRRSRQYNGFSHRFENPRNGEPANVSAIVCKDPALAKEFLAAHKAGDHNAQGALLGFPVCCREFFSEHWGKGYHDPIWQVAMNSPHDEPTTDDSTGIRTTRLVVTEAKALSNPMLRYIGPRGGFHIPHSFSCQDSIDEATKRLTAKDDPARTLLLAMLSMPMSWDAYHGLAVVRTPIFYLLTSTVPCAERHIVELPGTFMPAEAPCGAVHPFKAR